MANDKYFDISINAAGAQVMMEGEPLKLELAGRKFYIEIHEEGVAEEASWNGDLRAFSDAIVLLAQSKREHHHGDERGCPLTYPESHRPPSMGDECDCGADEWNRKVDETLARLGVRAHKVEKVE